MDTTCQKAASEVCRQAAKYLQSGELVAIPTETVYGLAADATNGQAVQKIFKAKGRPQDNPLISHISSMEMLPMVWREVTPQAKALAEAFWPGPLTIITTQYGVGRRSVRRAFHGCRALALTPGCPANYCTGRSAVGGSLCQYVRQSQPNHGKKCAGGHERQNSAHC